MKKQIQVVKNSDRVHVSINSLPVVTYLFSDYKSPQIAIAWAGFSAWNTAVELQEEGYEISLLPIETK